MSVGSKCNPPSLIADESAPSKGKETINGEINHHRHHHHGEAAVNDVFGKEEGHDIKYKTLSWQSVCLLMISEIVTVGMLSLPNALAIVGIVPGVILILFLGVFALYTAKLLIDFKINHPEVHNMGDAGLILFGPIGREVLSAGAIIFAVCAAGSLLLSGQQALSALSNNSLCALYFTLVFAVIAFLIALPRTFSGIKLLSLVSVSVFLLAGIVSMVGASINPVSGRIVQATVPTNFSEAFLAITNPIFAYAGHFMFFMLISEMRNPKDAMKAAVCLQSFATSFYVAFAVVIYCYIGSNVSSDAFLSLPPVWQKAAFGIGIINIAFAAGIYSHTGAKILFIRLFRHTQHLHTHTLAGWLVWLVLCLLAVGVAFVLAVAVPIFSYLNSITSALFASWYTYGVAGFFWLYDTYHLRGEDGSTRRSRSLGVFKQRPVGTALAVGTVLAGGFICVAGTYVSVKLIIEAYQTGSVGKPFTC